MTGVLQDCFPDAAGGVVFIPMQFTTGLWRVSSCFS